LSASGLPPVESAATCDSDPDAIAIGEETCSHILDRHDHDGVTPRRGAMAVATIAVRFGRMAGPSNCHRVPDGLALCCDVGSARDQCTGGTG
jgi:hypothetical protein